MPGEKRLVSTAARAFGEFVLIVAGVLVALAVDQYSEDRHERALETSYLLRLRDDVEASTGAIRVAAQNYLRAEGAVRYLDSLLTTPGAVPPGGSTLYLAADRGYDRSSLVYSRSALDEMESTGSLRLIRDPQVRKQVLSFYRWEEVFAGVLENHDLRFRYVARGLPFPSSSDRFHNDCPPDQHMTECDVEVPGIDEAEVWRELRSREEVPAMLQNSIRDFLRARQLLDEQSTRGDSLIALIDRSLGR